MEKNPYFGQSRDTVEVLLICVHKLQAIDLRGNLMYNNNNDWALDSVGPQTVKDKHTNARERMSNGYPQ